MAPPESSWTRMILLDQTTSSGAVLSGLGVPWELESVVCVMLFQVTPAGWARQETRASWHSWERKRRNCGLGRQQASEASNFKRKKENNTESCCSPSPPPPRGRHRHLTALVFMSPGCSHKPGASKQCLPRGCSANCHASGSCGNRQADGTLFSYY